MSGWIAVATRYPDPGDRVLCYNGVDVDFARCFYERNGTRVWEYDSGYRWEDDDPSPTHWMPLPDPPTEDKDHA